MTVRDRYSYEYITKNIPNVKCEKYPDMVLSLSDGMIPNVHSENALGISVHKSADINLLAEIADRFINETGRNVCLCVLIHAWKMMFRWQIKFTVL